MQVTWLGQAGLLLEVNGLTVMIDPYLSNSVKKPRQTPICDAMFRIMPDVMLFTHDHLDHYDPETVKHFLTEQTRITVLSPKSVFQKVRTIGGSNNYVQFDRHTRWTENSVSFTAVKAVHSDDCAIGVLIEDGSRTIYITGDTLYNSEVFHDLPQNIDLLFLPINGVGNNMNMTDAAAFAEMTKAKTVIPIHYGMFDNLDPARFPIKNKRILTAYEVTEL